MNPVLRLDVVTVFPDYLAPLRLSLIGKAIRDGLVTLGVHDLRDWTDDRHRTVDDAPFGGGAGMVMRPEPWGRALDELAGPDTVLVVPTPAGIPFTQRLATELAQEQHLVFACGRYEGIDARVTVDAAQRLRVVETSLGDYVLNGGEVAALAITEAVVRLVPGVLGNPESLVTESHAGTHDALLEGPAYTRPAVWRDLAVPEVLLSGDHARIAAWRRATALQLTRDRRPDLITEAVAALLVEPDPDARPGPGHVALRARLETGRRLGTITAGPDPERADAWRIESPAVEATAADHDLPDRDVVAALLTAAGDAAPTDRPTRLLVLPEHEVDSATVLATRVRRLGFRIVGRAGELVVLQAPRR